MDERTEILRVLAEFRGEYAVRDCGNCDRRKSCECEKYKAENDRLWKLLDSYYDRWRHLWESQNQLVEDVYSARNKLLKIYTSYRLGAKSCGEAVYGVISAIDKALAVSAKLRRSDG